MVSGELMTTLPLSSTILPPWLQTIQCAKLLPSPTALPSAKPAGLLLAFERLAHLQEVVGLLGKFREAGLLEHALAIEDAVADGGERQGDELVVLLRVAFEARVIAAVAVWRRSVAISVTSRSLSGYWNGSSNQTSMTSGPAPTLAATAAFGRMSSQLSLSTRTSTPVASVNFLVLASQASSSPFTKGVQRSTRKVAPCFWLEGGRRALREGRRGAEKLRASGAGRNAGGPEKQITSRQGHRRFPPQIRDL